MRWKSLKNKSQWLHDNLESVYIDFTRGNESYGKVESKFEGTRYPSLTVKPKIIKTKEDAEKVAEKLSQFSPDLDVEILPDSPDGTARYRTKQLCPHGKPYGDCVEIKCVAQYRMGL